MTIKTLNISKTKMLFFLLLIVWADIGITYIGLSKLKEKDPNNWINYEVSMTVSPIIKRLGLENGILLSGVINTLIILGIAILFPIEFTHGVLTGIFVLALAINLRLLFLL